MSSATALSLTAQLRDFKPEFRPGVMSRISWFSYLRVAYDQSAKTRFLDPASKRPLEFVKAEALMSSLLQTQHLFPLRPQEEYEQESSDLALSVEDVYGFIKPYVQDDLNWDTVLDLLISNPLLG